MRKLTTISAAAAGLVLAGGAAAAAVTAPPETADKGLTTAEENSGLELPASQGHPTPGDHPTGEDHPTGDDHPGGTNDAEGVDAAAEAHGAEVSAVARDDSTTGREHGESVSEVARAGHGGPAEASLVTDARPVGARKNLAHPADRSVRRHQGPAGHVGSDRVSEILSTA